MAIAPELVELMTESIVIYDTAAFTGTGYGTATLGTGVTHNAFVQRRQRVARDAYGIAVRSDFDVYTDSILDGLSSEDYISYDGKWYQAVQVNIYRDEEGPHHTMIGMAEVSAPV